MQKKINSTHRKFTRIKKVNYLLIHLLNSAINNKKRLILKALSSIEDPKDLKKQTYNKIISGDVEALKELKDSGKLTPEIQKNI